MVDVVDGDEGWTPPAPGAIRRLATTAVTVTSESELRDAIAASDTTIVLGSDITVTQQIEVAGGQTNLVVKAGAGNTISGGGTTRVFYITDGAVSLDGVSLVDGSSGNAYGGCVYVEGGGASLTMVGGEIKNCEASSVRGRACRSTTHSHSPGKSVVMLFLVPHD